MKSGLCLKCRSESVGRLSSLPDTGKSETETHWQAVGTLPDGARVGVLEAYVCTKCGYLETYVKQPDQVPFEKITGFKWVNTSPDAAGPYR